MSGTNHRDMFHTNYSCKKIIKSNHPHFKVEIPFVRLETPASVIIGTLGMSPFIVVPEDCYKKHHNKSNTGVTRTALIQYV